MIKIKNVFLGIKKQADKFLEKVDFNSRKGIALGMVLLLMGAGISYAQFYKTTGSTGFGYGYGYGYESGYGYGYGYHQSDGEDSNYGYLYSNRLPLSASSGITKTSATITVTTEYKAFAKVDYGTTSGSLSGGSYTSTYATSTAVSLSGLSCGTTYYYKSAAKDIGGNEWEESSENSFSTLDCSTTSSSSGTTSSSPSGTEEETEDEETPKTEKELRTKISELIRSLINTINELIAKLQQQLSELRGMEQSCDDISFDRNLQVGMTGDDVKCLQITLNSSTDTQVAASGVGSPGNETSYFGSLTRAAVIKFQEKYADEILAPLNLTAGTGFVGELTRTKLNQLAGN